MKKGVLSILVAIIGFYCVYKFNIQMYQENLALVQPESDVQLRSNVSIFHKTYKIIVMSIGLLSLYFGVISFLKKHKIGLVGITLALILIVSCFSPFLENIIEAHLYNINFQ